MNLFSKSSAHDEIKGIIFDIQRFAVHDGPGIRTLVFMKGCPLRCIWCDNPESQNMCPEIAFFSSKCTRCERCLTVCPVGAITISEENVLKINRKLCTICGKCEEVCPNHSIKLVGKQITAREVFEDVEKDRLFYQNSGGGITIGGGEATGQSEFLLELLKKCKEEGLHTTVETSGYIEWERMEKILPYLDLVYLDIKHMDPLKHRELTGVSNELILENAKKIAPLTPMIIRVPVIPGYNDLGENIKATARFVAKLGSVRARARIELLPYHRLGEMKYEQLGREYKLKGLQPPSIEYMQRLEEIVESNLV